MNNINEITPKDVFDILQDRKTKLIDVRSFAEYSQAKISNSINIPLHLVPLNKDEFSKHDHIVVYCASGSRSRQACRFLMQNGIKNVHNMSGGIIHWARSNLPVTR